MITKNKTYITASKLAETPGVSLGQIISHYKILFGT